MKSAIVSIIGYTVSFTLIQGVFKYELFSKEFWFVIAGVCVAGITGAISKSVN